MAELVGFLNLLKPPGMTSHDVVAAVRRLLPRRTKVGHLGTLDPSAAGVLPVAVGRATKLISLLPDLGPEMKGYLAEVQLGWTTSTDDLDGEPLEPPLSPERVQRRLAALEGCPREVLERRLAGFEGGIEQVPPQVSALKVDGERAYRKAFRGEQVELPPRSVQVQRCRLVSGLDSEARFRFELHCSTGTYVRSVARDLGRQLGLGGCLSFLLRTHSGEFELAWALTLEELRAQGVAAHLRPESEPFVSLPLLNDLELHQKGQRVPLGPKAHGDRFRAPGGLLRRDPESPQQAVVEALFGRGPS